MAVRTYDKGTLFIIKSCLEYQRVNNTIQRYQIKNESNLTKIQVFSILCKVILLRPMRTSFAIAIGKNLFNNNDGTWSTEFNANTLGNIFGFIKKTSLNGLNVRSGTLSIQFKLPTNLHYLAGWELLIKKLLDDKDIILKILMGIAAKDSVITTNNLVTWLRDIAGILRGPKGNTDNHTSFLASQWLADLVEVFDIGLIINLGMVKFGYGAMQGLQFIELKEKKIDERKKELYDFITTKLTTQQLRILGLYRERTTKLIRVKLNGRLFTYHDVDHFCCKVGIIRCKCKGTSGGTIPIPSFCHPDKNSECFELFNSIFLYMLTGYSGYLTKITISPKLCLTTSLLINN